MKRVHVFILFVLAMFCGFPVATAFTMESAGTEWITTYNSPGNGYDSASKMVTDSSGNVYVTGTIGGTTSNWDDSGLDILTTKYSSSGVKLWEARYNGTGNGADTTPFIAVDANGNVYIAGASLASDGKFNVLTIKYSPDGVQQWEARWANPSHWFAIVYGIGIDANGNVYVAGQSPLISGHDILTIKYDPDGNKLWEASYNAPENGDDSSNGGIAVDGSGNVYVAGNIGGGTHGYLAGRDYALLKYDSNGGLQWVSRYNGPGNFEDIAYAIALDAGGNIYLTGRSYGNGTGFDYATVKFNPDGVQQWAARYSTSGADIANAIQIDSNGNVYVTGQSKGDMTGYGDYSQVTGNWETSDITTVKYDSNGNQQWVAEYNGPANRGDIGTALALDSAGNAYVTGYSQGGATGYNYVTIKYSSTGSQEWVQQYTSSGTADDMANSVAVDANSNVYVTGNSNNDYVTVKYSQQAVSWWAGDGNANDSIGLNNGTLQNGATATATGKIGQAFSFDGVDDNVLIPDSPSLNPTDAMTLEAWVYVTGYGDGHRDIISKDGESFDRQYELTVSSINRFRAHVGIEGMGFMWFDGATDVAYNTWYHVAQTYDGSVLRLYVNGVLDGSMNVSGRMITTAQPVRIGGGGPSGTWQLYFPGLIDEAKLFDRALTADEIAAQASDNDYSCQVWYKDADNDGYSDGATLTQCTIPFAYKAASELTATSGDCADNNPAVHPGAAEIPYNGIDENCNGIADDDPVVTVVSVVHGSISPSGAVTVALNGSQTFTITPDTGHHITDVLVDGASVGVVTNYTFSSVTINHIISAVFASTYTSANTIIVPDTFATIQAAIDAAVNGDTILVRPGTYYENINFRGKAVTLRSTDGAAGTIIDGMGLAPVISFHYSESGGSVLEGLTIRNGNSSGGWGGGVSLVGASPTIRDCIIRDNQGRGIGMFYPSSPRITNCTITNNGGGIWAYGSGSNPVFEGCTISNNSTSAGGGVYVYYYANVTINNSTISGNTAANGGGVYNYWGTLNLTNSIVSGNTAQIGGGISSDYRSLSFINNCTITGNIADSGGGIWSDSNGTWGNGTLYIEMTNSIVYSNSSPSHFASYYESPHLSNNDLESGWTSGSISISGTIDADPMFVDAQNGDYHLLPGSPCTDQGVAFWSTPSYDKDGIHRPQGGAKDIGAYEYVFLDNDHDGFTTYTDCNDSDPLINPTGSEIFNNGIDENCNGMHDDSDADNDLHPSTVDCNDGNPSIHPGAAEIHNDGIDQNCNGMGDEWDRDLDGYDATVDCDDNNALINPGMIETPYNGIDENCNGMYDDNDFDRDGYNVSQDCNDNDPLQHPWQVWYKDTDNDGYSNGTTLRGCARPFGYKVESELSAASGDCDDNNLAINPGVAEIPYNNMDENCNGMRDDNDIIAVPGGPYWTGTDYSVTLDGSGSYHFDPGKSVKSWNWDLDGDGIFETTGMTVTASWPQAGSYTVSLKVSDNGNPASTATASTLVVVEDMQTAVICPAEGSSVLSGETAIFSAAAGNHVVSYLWSSDKDGMLSDRSRFSTSNLTTGTHVITCRITDSLNRISETSVTFTVNPRTSPSGSTMPVATYEFNNSLGAKEQCAPALTAVDPLGMNAFEDAALYEQARRVYHFDGNSRPVEEQAGLSLDTSGLIGNNHYSVEMVFEFMEGERNWRRVLDVKDRVTDNGFYIEPNGKLNIYPIVSGSSSFTNNQFHHVVLTNENGVVKGYLDGKLEFETASTEEMNIDNPRGVLNFFLDNIMNGGQGEFADGKVALIRVYDGILTDPEITEISKNPLDLDRPVAIINGPYLTIKDSPLTLDGSASFHLNSGKRIVSWEWDLDNDGIFETAGQTITHTWFQSGVYTISLRVTDDSQPAQTAISSTTVVVEADVDQDGYTTATDCNDNNPSINIGAAEIPYNGIDENCNGMSDDDDQQSISLWAGNGNANDSIGLNYGTFQNGATATAEGMVGQAFGFDGFDDNVLIPDSPSLNPKDAMTLQAWVYVTGWGQGHRDIVSKDGEYFDRQYELTASDANRFRAHIGIEGLGFIAFDGATDVELNKWYHVAQTYDGSVLRLYVNGVLDGSMDVSGHIITTTQPVRIGGGAPSGAWQLYFPGLIDEVKLYARVLTAEEIADYVSGVLNNQCSGQIWYKDADTDGYSDGATLTQCTIPFAYKAASELTATSGDCADNNPAVHPGAAEIPYNGRDENCNGMADDDDLDHDGYGIATDYNDNNASIYPGAVEIPYNGIDENYNGMADDDDLDRDGYGIASDCNDNNSAVHPGAVEIPLNGTDENCNGMTDDSTGTPTAVILQPGGDVSAYFGEAVTFQGSTGTTVAEYAWYIDGILVSNQRSFSYSLLPVGGHEITYKVKDSIGRWSEAAARQITVFYQPARADLALEWGDISFYQNDVEVTNPGETDPVRIKATIHNLSTEAASSPGNVYFYDTYVTGNQSQILLGSAEVPAIAPDGTATVEIIWTPDSQNAQPGYHLIQVMAAKDSNETYVDNNTATHHIVRGDRLAAGTVVIDILNLNVYNQQQLYVGTRFTISGYAQYHWQNGYLLPVLGGKVTIRLGDYLYETRTGSNGWFYQEVVMPSVPGSYPLNIEVSDSTISGQRQMTLSAVSIPDAYPGPPTGPDLTVYSIQLANGVAEMGETVYAYIVNQGGDAAGGAFTNHIQITSPSGETVFTDTRTYDSAAGLCPGCRVIIPFSGWTPAVSGNYRVTVATDYNNGITELNENNNTSAVTIYIYPRRVDLEVTEVRKSCNTISAMVVNRGGLSSTGGTLRFADASGYYDMAALPAIAGKGGAVWINAAPYNNGTSANTTITVSVESGEDAVPGNNTRSGVFDFTRRSDLAVSDLRVNEQPWWGANTVYISLPNTLLAEVRNLGCEPASGTLQFSVDGTAKGGIVTVPEIPGGGSTIVSTAFDFAGYTAGTNYILSANAAVSPVYIDAVPGNNSLAERLTVSPQLPDYRVSSEDIHFSVNSGHPARNEKFIISADIHNVGLAEGNEFQVAFYQDGQILIGTIQTITITPGIQPGGSLTVYPRDEAGNKVEWGNGYSGNHAIMITVAPLAGIENDPNDADNSATRKVWVNYPPQAHVAATGTSSTDRPDDTLSFSAAGSNDNLDIDGKGGIIRYDWDFGDGQTASTVDPIDGHTYSVGGNYTITVTVTDNSNESSTASITQQVTIDRTPPIITPSVNPHPNTSGWNNTDVRVEFACSDVESGIASCTEPMTVTTEGVARVVTGTATDSAQNTATVPVILNIDKTLPIGSVMINGNAVSTASTSVALTLSATDNLSGIYQMRFSNDNINWSAWEAYNTSRNWTLSNTTHLMTVYVQFMDNAGNVSGSYSDSIYMDTDTDGIYDSVDNCRLVSNADQADVDGDGIGNICDDSDNDGVFDAYDNCRVVSNSNQADKDGDGMGDVCDDSDSDGVFDAYDNCYLTPNTDQADFDGDGIGDVCDDSDGDTVFDSIDNCRLVANTDQSDRNGNGIGDACDGDVDGDTIVDIRDNCPTTANLGQADADNDGIGDVCDPCLNDATNACAIGSQSVSSAITQPETVSNGIGTASVTVEPGDLTQDTTITVSTETTTGNFAYGANQQVMGAVYTFTASPSSAFVSTVTIVLKYSQGAMPEGGRTEEMLDIYYYNPTTLKWEPQNAAQDMVNNTLTAQVPHFSNYAVIMTENPVSDLIAAFRGVSAQDQSTWGNLMNQLSRAFDEYEGGNNEAVKNDLRTFINKVESESREKIAQQAADMLIRFANEVIAKL